jgi:hypothetical protein
VATPANIVAAAKARAAPAVAVLKFICISSVIVRGVGWKVVQSRHSTRERCPDGVTEAMKKLFASLKPHL